MATVRLANSHKLPNQLTLQEQPVKTGGEGIIYRTTDNQYAVKIYHSPSIDKPQLLKKILDLGVNMRAEDAQHLAWPLGMISHLDQQPKVGVVTRWVPFVGLNQLIFDPFTFKKQVGQGASWIEYVKMARGVAAALRTIHGYGMAHADIHFKNFLGNPKTGEVVLIDLDGLVVQGFLPPQVIGLPGFIAPEVVMGASRPSESTDRYSAAVLILWILLFRNVMLSQVTYDEDDQKHDDELAYGKEACFSEHPQDRRNWFHLIGMPLGRQGQLSYRSLTPRLQDLTSRALVDGLHDPTKRPQVLQWERALAEAYDTFIACPACNQFFFYPYWVQPPPIRKCPFCGMHLRHPFPVVVEVLEERAKGEYVSIRPLVLYDGMPLFADVATPGKIPPFTRRNVARIGFTTYNRKQDDYYLMNTSDETWQVINDSGIKIPRGDSVRLKKGLKMSLGNGQRMLAVKE